MLVGKHSEFNADDLRFESGTQYKYGGVAHMVERNTEDVGVGSSILSSPTNDFKRNLFKNETEGYKTKT